MSSWDEIFATRTGRMGASEIRELLKVLDRPDVITLAGGIPDPALFPAGAFNAAYSAILTSSQAGNALQYSLSEGYAPLREWIAARMNADGVPCTRDNIFITSGSQQGLDYLGKLFLSPNDTALVTWPTYLGALQAFNAFEPAYDQLSPGGNRAPQSYRESAVAAGGRAKFAYLCPDFANPTGETLDLAGREAVLDLAADLGVAVIEDAAYRDLRYEGENLPSIMALDCARSGGIEDTRTIYCGSFSKTLSPGLRVGWVCANSEVIHRLVLAKQAADLHSPTINQMAVHRVAEAVFAEQVEKTKAVYKSRLDAMLSALEHEMPDGTIWTRPEGGMFVWVTLPDGVDGAELLVRSLETEKVAFVPGKAFFADGTGANHIRLNFSNANEEKLAEAVRRLARLIKAF
ncbi:MAG: GntR family transcriptional regulator [Hyphomicrobiales bacterium]|nr:MAG: GntR family transcriptional regulator [Hyphomicrobiales bacterium]